MQATCGVLWEKPWTYNNNNNNNLQTLELAVPTSSYLELNDPLNLIGVWNEVALVTA